MLGYFIHYSSSNIYFEWNKYNFLIAVWISPQS